MARGCVMATSTDAVCSWDVSCSQNTQASITSSAIGTQCSPTVLISRSAQTEGFSVCMWPVGHPSGRRENVLLTPHTGTHRQQWEGLPATFFETGTHKEWKGLPVDFLETVLEVDNAEVGASEKFPASRGGAGMAVAAGPHICPCTRHSCDTGSFSSDSKEIWFGRKLHSCLSCQQCDHPSAHLKVCARKTLYMCAVCKKVFCEKFNLKRHMRVHTGERPYVCTTCQRSFAERASLVTHERLHSVEKPYVCSLCQKQFTKKSHLDGHQRLHSGERPYVCSTCQKSFCKRSNLVSHERIHSGEKPFLCTICQKSFARRYNLVAHRRLHS